MQRSNFKGGYGVNSIPRRGAKSAVMNPAFRPHKHRDRTQYRRKLKHSKQETEQG